MLSVLEVKSIGKGFDDELEYLGLVIRKARLLLWQLDLAGRISEVNRWI
jgi:hypothetical protein